MKVTVSVRGRFHAFDLARQLERRGHLHRLITSYPGFAAVQYGVPASRVTSLASHEAASRGWQRIPPVISARWNLQHFFHNAFDRAASGYIPADTDLYVGWSSFSERGLIRAREIGAVTILERGSSHIEYQRVVLQEEYDRLGTQGELPHPAIVEKERREYTLADYISVPSEFARRTFLDRGFPEGKLIRVPYGVDLDSFQSRGSHDGVFRLLYVGTMSLRKGVHYLLRAFAELKLPGAELWLVGARTNEMEPFFHRYNGSFRHLEPVPQASLRDFYNRCSALCLCSIEDGFAMVASQAMACELPVICTVNTGAADLVTDGQQGFVIPIRNIDALKAAILELYQDPARRTEMGRSARLKVGSGFTWDDYGQRVVAEYRGMLERVSVP